MKCISYPLTLARSRFSTCSFGEFTLHLPTFILTIFSTLLIEFRQFPTKSWKLRITETVSGSLMTHKVISDFQVDENVISTIGGSPLLVRIVGIGQKGANCSKYIRGCELKFSKLPKWEWTKLEGCKVQLTLHNIESYKLICFSKAGIFTETISTHTHTRSNFCVHWHSGSACLLIIVFWYCHTYFQIWRL